MAEVITESSHRQFRVELLLAVKALKSHVTNQDKFAAGLDWKR